MRGRDCESGAQGAMIAGMVRLSDRLAAAGVLVVAALAMHAHAGRSVASAAATPAVEMAGLPSLGFAAPQRDQRRSRSASSDRRDGARCHRRSDRRHQLDRQSRQAEAPRAGRRPRIAGSGRRAGPGAPSRRSA